MLYCQFRKNSFESVNEWMKEIQDNTDQDVLVYLVGNRADLESDREVSVMDAKKYVRE